MTIWGVHIDLGPYRADTTIDGPARRPGLFMRRWVPPLGGGGVFPLSPTPIDTPLIPPARDPDFTLPTRLLALCLDQYVAMRVALDGRDGWIVGPRAAHRLPLPDTLRNTVAAWLVPTHQPPRITTVRSRADRATHCWVEHRALWLATQTGRTTTVTRSTIPERGGAALASWLRRLVHRATAHVGPITALTTVTTGAGTIHLGRDVLAAWDGHTPDVTAVPAANGTVQRDALVMHDRIVTIVMPRGAPDD